MRVAATLGQKLLQIIPTMVLVALLVFGLMRLLPGDPAIVLLGDRATDAGIARLHAEMGLDEPLPWQFWLYLKRLATGEFGNSVSLRVPVAQLIADRLPVTLMLTVMAAAIALLLAVPLAFAAALRPGGVIDAAVQVFCQVGLSAPVFYVGLVLLITLAAGLGWFPVGGIGESFTENLYYLFLPALTLALSLAAILMRNLRAALIEVLGAEFITFARAKGLSARLVLGRHVLRNAIVSTVTLFGLHVGTLVGGAVITETVFAIPGIGRLTVDSIFARDYPVVQGLTLVLAAMVSVVFLVVDAVQAALDPRAGT